jgi:hypothetical protein
VIASGASENFKVKLDGPTSSIKDVQDEDDSRGYETQKGGIGFDYFAI